MPETALALEGISKRFGSTFALNDASFFLRAGTVHALLGENGAGKTTLMRIAYGLVQPDTGTVRIHGKVTRVHDPATAIRAGVGMVHQHFTIVHAMTVAENVALGGHGRFDRKSIRERIRSIGAMTGIDLDPDAPAGSLGVGAQQQLEIMKALGRSARILILDEPTAVLAPREADGLLQQLQRLAAHGMSIVLITHKLREALMVAEDVTVLRQGRTIVTAPATSVSEQMLADAMLGTEARSIDSRELRAHAPTVEPTHPPVESDKSITASVGRRTRESSEPHTLVVRAIGLTLIDERGTERVRNASFHVAAGEIVGLAGIEGSGVHVLLRAVAGRSGVSMGTLDRPPTVGFVPEDRHRDALVLEFTLTENIALRGAATQQGRMPWSELRARTRALIAEFDIRAASTEQTATTLSGGNQQKLVLARELADAPPLLVIENPTRGLDLRASASVHRRLRAARDSGTAILAYSSDLDELVAVADRVLVVFAGGITEVACNRDQIGQAMLGAGTSTKPASLAGK